MAVYFLGLGLVNSQANPRLVNARTDFVLLSIAFFPLIIGPVLFLVQHGHLLVAGVVVAASALAFWALLPARGGAGVIYNISPLQYRRIVERAGRRIGCQVSRQGD